MMLHSIPPSIPNYVPLENYLARVDEALEG